MNSDLPAEIEVVVKQLEALMESRPGLESAQQKRWKRELILKLNDLRRAEWGD